MTDARIARSARRQLGLVTTAQVLQEVPLSRLKRLLAARELEPVRLGVYRIAGAPASWEQALLAACLARPGSQASFRSAAYVWRLSGFERDVLEITGEGTRRARLAGVIVHESQVWGTRHVAKVDGVPVSSVARTLCDLSALSAVVSPVMIERALDDALRRKIVTMKKIEAVASDLAGRGRRRSTVTRELVEARGPGYHPGESEPEKRIADLVERGGLPRPVPQHRIRVGNRTLRADLAYPELAIAIEYDSDAFHRTKSQLEADARRRNLLRVAGFTVLEFTSASSDREIVDMVSQARRRAPAA